MFNKKLITTLGMSLVLIGSLFGCGNNKSANVQTQPASVKQESTTKSAETATLPAVDNKPVVDATEASTENTTVENTEAAVENVETPAVNSENVAETPVVVETPVEVPVEVVEQVTEAPVQASSEITREVISNEPATEAPTQSNNTNSNSSDRPVPKNIDNLEVINNNGVITYTNPKTGMSIDVDTNREMSEGAKKAQQMAMDNLLSDDYGTPKKVDASEAHRDVGPHGMKSKSAQ